MEGKKTLFIVIGLVVLGVIGYFFVSGNASNSSVEQTSQQSVTENVQGVNQQQEDLGNPGSSERFVAYSEENLKKATENNGKAIVFFHAGWCPSCQAAEKELKEKWSEVPQDVTILKTDYDTSTELKAKYGITMQDTWVQVDSQGNEITKWNSGGEGLKTLLANLK